jgi:hypothetical protein
MLEDRCDVAVTANSAQKERERKTVQQQRALDTEMALQPRGAQGHVRVISSSQEGATFEYVPSLAGSRKMLIMAPYQSA